MLIPGVLTLAAGGGAPVPATIEEIRENALRCCREGREERQGEMRAKEEIGWDERIERLPLKTHARSEREREEI